MFKESSIPNMLTIGRILLTPLFIYLLFIGNTLSYFLALLVFLTASLTDYADGKIARKYGYSSEFGKFMDPLADKILVMSTFIVFALMHFAPWWMVIVVLMRDIIITVVRSIMSKRGQSMNTSKIAKVKTVIQMVFIYTVLVWLFLAHYPLLKVLHPLLHAFRDFHGFWVLMLLTTMLTAYTGVLYFFENKQIFVRTE